MQYTVHISQRISQYIDSYKLLARGSRVLVALSGGADSVFLLRWLLAEGYTAHAAHCNFQLRGDESIRDERFVRRLCHDLSVPLHVTSFDTDNYARSHGISIEMAARELRYDYFEQLRTTLELDCIAVAHHRDDNIETAILNAVRGTGIKGLSGIQSRNGHIVRPLLCVSRSEIEACLADMGQDYVTDSTNLASLYSRNKVRLEVMPMLRNINPGADDNLATTIENLNEARKIYDAAIDYYAAQCVSSGSQPATLCINRERLSGCPSPIALLHHLLSPFGFNRTQLTDMLRESRVGTVFASATHRAVTSRTDIVVAPLHAESSAMPLPVEQCNDITMEITGRKDLTISHDSNYAYIDRAKVHGPIMVRHPQPGDRFHPYCMKGSKLISDFLTDLKLNRIEKEEQLLVCDDRDILWVVGRRSSELHKVTGNTVDVIVLRAKN